MTLAQHTLISTSHNSRSTESSFSIGIQCPGTDGETKEQQNIEVLELDSGTSQDSLTKMSKLNLKPDSSVNNKLADSLLHLLTEIHASLLNFLAPSKTVNAIRRSTVEEDSSHCLITDTKTGNHISMPALIETIP